MNSASHKGFLASLEMTMGSAEPFLHMSLREARQGDVAISALEGGDCFASLAMTLGGEPPVRPYKKTLTAFKRA